MNRTNVFTLKDLQSWGSTYTPSEVTSIYFIRTSDRRLGTIKIHANGECFGKFNDDLDSDYLPVDDGISGILRYIKTGDIDEPSKLDLYLAGLEQ